MALFNVAFVLEQQGKEYREDIFVNAHNEEDAVDAAKEKLPRGVKVKKVIFVEKKD